MTRVQKEIYIFHCTSELCFT